MFKTIANNFKKIREFSMLKNLIQIINTNVGD